MSPDQVVLVRASYRLLDQVKGQAAGMFYGRLFTIAPEVRPLFAGSDMFRQSEKLWNMLGTIVSMLDEPSHLVPAIEELAQDHVRYGVQPEFYRPVGDALLWTLEHGLGASWSEDTRHAWEAAFTALSQIMIRAAYTGGAPETSHT